MLVSQVRRSWFDDPDLMFIREGIALEANSSRVVALPSLAGHRVAPKSRISPRVDTTDLLHAVYASPDWIGRPMASHGHRAADQRVEVSVQDRGGLFANSNDAWSSASLDLSHTVTLVHRRLDDDASPDEPCSVERLRMRAIVSSLGTRCSKLICPRDRASGQTRCVRCRTLHHRLPAALGPVRSRAPLLCVSCSKSSSVTRDFACEAGSTACPSPTRGPRRRRRPWPVRVLDPAMKGSRTSSVRMDPTPTFPIRPPPVAYASICTIAPFVATAPYWRNVPSSSRTHPNVITPCTRRAQMVVVGRAVGEVLGLLPFGRTLVRRHPEAQRVASRQHWCIRRLERLAGTPSDTPNVSFSMTSAWRRPRYPRCVGDEPVDHWVMHCTMADPPRRVTPWLAQPARSPSSSVAECCRGTCTMIDPSRFSHPFPSSLTSHAFHVVPSYPPTERWIVWVPPTPSMVTGTAGAPRSAEPLRSARPARVAGVGGLLNAANGTRSLIVGSLLAILRTAPAVSTEPASTQRSAILHGRDTTGSSVSVRNVAVRVPRGNVKVACAGDDR